MAKTLSQLVEVYNKLRKGKKPITRFASMADAKKRVAAAKMSMPSKNQVSPIKKAPKQKATPKAAVIVSGTTYGSVLKAFTALKLPIGKHEKFRKELKQTKDGQLTFNKMKFKIAHMQKGA